MRKEVKINLRIDEEAWERFKQIARREDLSASQMIRAFIRGKLSEESATVDPEPPERPRGKGSKRKGE